MQKVFLEGGNTKALHLFEETTLSIRVWQDVLRLIFRAIS